MSNHGRWSVEQAAAWRERVGWLAGCNYNPRTAGNQLEMWQAETFDPATIDQELGWAAGLGFNSMRVYLHDLAWSQDRAGFLGRVERFLDIAAGHGIGALFVFFDSCWHPFPRPGRQPEPEPGVHNSIWLQSPGVSVLRRAHKDPAAFEPMLDYVAAVVSHFRGDERIHAWDLWNEPENANDRSHGPRDLGKEKGDIIVPLLERSFARAREAGATQPLTSAPWLGQDWSKPENLSAIQRVQLAESDVISYHCYGGEMRQRIESLRPHGRPILCTEYMARPVGTTFANTLPLLRQEGVAAYNWGFVDGRSQTKYAWNTWAEPAPGEPDPWFHEILRADGTPYDPAEAEVIRRETAAGQSVGA